MQHNNRYQKKYEIRFMLLLFNKFNWGFFHEFEIDLDPHTYKIMSRCYQLSVHVSLLSEDLIYLFKCSI